MKRSGDREIGKSGNREGDFTAQARRLGEELFKNLTTEARRDGEESDDRVIGKAPSALALFAKTIRTIRATLREIFDESAYDRFLLRTNALRSVTTYREFTQERDAAMVKKPRCC